MNKQLSPLWTHLTSENRVTGTWRSALPNYQNQPSPCLGACPVNGRIAEWIKQVKDGDLRDAWVTLTDNNPFPAIAGRICHHPCETACNRRDLDETVGICSLERFAGDTALAEGWSFPPPVTERPQSIAIIGGGPAGLSAAYQLRRRGFKVSLYEAKDALGGLMRYGIPSYRLERSVLDGEIDRIVAMGIDLHLGAEVMNQAALATLQETHDAVLLATGASLPKRLPALDYARSWVIDSAEFLAAPVEEQRSRTGAQVVVIGGGSAAMDVARSARRLGSEVTVLALEPQDRLPAQKTEVDEAIEEGIVFVCGAMMQSAETNDNGATLRCVRVDFDPGDVPGTFTVSPIEGSGFEINAATIIPAIGQDADLERWSGLAPAGPVLGTDSVWQTDTPGVFAVGDVASMNRFVTQAVGMGKEAALAIADMLSPGIAAPAPAAAAEVEYSRINVAYQDTHARIQQQVTGLDERLTGFEEVQLPLSVEEAAAEARRCFSCGTCIYCDNCFFYCPDMAISRTASGYEVNVDYCKGCGLCVAECPTGSIHMQEDTAS
ncbi:MAG: FAD-dependent oxidoreductase [Roseibium sp.]|uniref:NAD(P)-binding protein n=1 Tax=Roseibium sp. TaxID=1936156 RepID=UPI0026209C64|nr:NAD(P)-binding protein [Roseibium sp.]MCV0427989.1 FAD-dependent oxidoreductase [Roseibium sp.]